MKMILDEGKVFGARYHTVQPILLVDTLTWYHQEWNDMTEWCIDNFGETKGAFEPSQRWYSNNAKYWFRNEADRNWFVLRWS
jgi:hypothetical protein